MSPLSGVLTEAWALYRRYAAHFLLIAFVIYLITAVLYALLTLIGVAGYVIAEIIALAAAFLLQAALVKAVQDVRDGRVDLDLGQTYRAAVPFILPVAGASILAAIGIFIGFALIIVPGLILLTFWCLIVPCIVIGGAGVFPSFGQSYRTVRGYAWNVFGTLVIVFLLYLAFAIVVGLILVVLPTFLRNFVSTVVVGTLVAPFLALVVTLVYYRLTAAHAGQPYVATSPEGTAVWEPPYPTAPGPPAPPGPAPADTTIPRPEEPGSTAPYPTTPGPPEPGPGGPPGSGPGPGSPPPPPPPPTPGTT
jgi:hypothetical protein